MNYKYLKFLIRSGIRTLTGAAALAAAAVILNSDDKKEPQSSEKEAPKPEKAPEAAPKEARPSENDAYYAAKAAQAKKAASQADYIEPRETLHTEKSGKRQSIYVPDDREFKKADVIRVKISEVQAIQLGISFRKKSKSIRITNYHGTEKSIIIPTYIGGMLVNEIGANAFKGSCVERVAIPDSVKKLGESAFAESSVRFVVFGNGLLSLPKMSFYNCKRLETVAIPPRTRKLGEKAFYGCKSLKYIELPRSLYEVGEDCFCESGLEGFSAHFRSHFQYNSAFDGSAFANTPLHKNNELILYRSYDPSNDSDRMKVLLVGENADVIFDHAPYVYLGRNSVCAPCDLDFLECKSIWAINAFKYKPSYINETEEPPDICVYLPEGYCASFPCFVKTFYPNGGETKCYEILEEGNWGKPRRIKLKTDLCDHSLILEEIRKIAIEPGNNRIGTGVIVAPDLEKLEIYGDFHADGEIFAHVCRGLCEVKLRNSKQNVPIYIPSGYIISRDIHRELLKAFCSNDSGGFFEPKVIENVFENGVIREKSKTHIQLSHREKILIAIDVLRSSPELYPNGTEKYSRFLKRHIEYAKKICGKLRDHPEYLEFLGKFTPKQGDVQMSKKSQNICGFPDEYYPKISEIYVPEKYEPEKADVPKTELTEKQAVEEGWSFQKKSKSVRITNYHGKQRDVIVPHKIGGLRVNELSAKAFMNTKVGRVRIPDGIVKAGRDLFMRSTVRIVIFGSGLDVIPEYAFFQCKDLEHIILPDTLWAIKKYAFCGCKSLEYIKLPDSLFSVGSRAFENSGLKGFSMRYPTRLNNGSAFCQTPLHQKYKLIATRNNENSLDILLVGIGAKVKLPKVYTTFKHNSLCSNCSLDISECTGLDMQRAVTKTLIFKFNVIAAHGQEGYYFGKHADVKYTDGTPYPGLLRPIKQDGDELTVEFAGVAFRHQFIPSEYVHFGVKSLKITTKLFMTLYEAAFHDPELEKLEIDYYFSTRGEIFFNCTALREMRWKGKNNKGNFVQYIPPAKLITNHVHWELLKAFRDTNDWGFFDSSVIDKIFSDKRLESQYYFTSANPRNKIRQRELILIAIDVLRGTPEQFANGTEMYSGYLRRHLKYAHKICERIKPEYPEYAEFLENFK